MEAAAAERNSAPRTSNPHAITLPDALRALGSLCLLQYKIDEKTTVTKLPQPRSNQQQILAAWASRFRRPVGRHSPLRGEQQKLRHQKVSSKIANRIAKEDPSDEEMVRH